MASALEIRVRGRVQGVGFRPTVWRIARELGVRGEILNDGEGVLVRAIASAETLAAFIARVEDEPPPLARIDAIETAPYVGELGEDFQIVASVGGGGVQTQIAPDAAMCPACAAEIDDPSNRRYRYPFTTCTHCGPRLTIVTGVPYDRAATTLARFPLCAPCATEYADPADRRFHAETTACPVCGPQTSMPVSEAVERIARGEIVAIKGLGAYHLACDATNAEAVARLRAAKHRDAKPFALMARSLDVIRRYCVVSSEEAAALASTESPIVLLAAAGERLPDAIAPNLTSLGFMLPTTPLHHLIARERPLVMTSGNLSDEPPAFEDATRLATVVPWILDHDRPIANRVDDSVVRFADGAIRVLRRARGYAPAPIALPAGFARAPQILAYGGDLKGAFCMTARGEAILSQHQGDLENAATLADFEKHLALYAMIFAHAPVAVACDRHPGFHSTRLARASGLPVVDVQHHHAHVAACLAEIGRPLDAPPVLGVVMDGLGLGDDGTIWGGEFLRADYRRAERLASLTPVRMLGGDAASREPWRNLYAQRAAAGLPQPANPTLDRMLETGFNSPLASSCGRLFDAVAAAVGICVDPQAYEGEAAMRLEAAVDPDERGAYPFAIGRTLDPAPMWRALFADAGRVPVGAIAARFHRGLAQAIAQMVRALGGGDDVVVLTGGCFQNRVLLEHAARELRAAGATVLAHARVPTNDGGLALGQAAVCAARLMT